jgi:hypothetical protein
VVKLRERRLTTGLTGAAQASFVWFPECSVRGPVNSIVRRSKTDLVTSKHMNRNLRALLNAFKPFADALLIIGSLLVFLAQFFVLFSASKIVFGLAMFCLAVGISATQLIAALNGEAIQVRSTLKMVGYILLFSGLVFSIGVMFLGGVIVLAIITAPAAVRWLKTATGSFSKSYREMKKEFRQGNDL